MHADEWRLLVEAGSYDDVPTAAASSSEYPGAAIFQGANIGVGGSS